MGNSASPRMTLQTIKALGVLLQRHPEPLSGADIFNQTKMFSGTLYPILARLEKAAWLTSDWEDVDPHEVGRPRRRLYQLTALGQRSARAELADLENQTSGTLGSGLAEPRRRPA